MLDLNNTLRTELTRGERLLWSGMPAQGLRLRPSDALMIPFSLMWGGFAIVWEFGVSVSHAPLGFSLWGVPFVLIGLYMMVGRFFHDSYQRARMCYAVTDERVLIVREAWPREVKSLALQGLSEISISERSDGSGSIQFGPKPSGRGAPEAPAFEFIEHARRVYEIIREAQAAERER